MKPKPLHRSITFWSGIPVIGFFVWGYFYSLLLGYATELMISNARGESFHASLSYGRIYLSAEQTGPLLPSPPREWRILEDRHSDVAYAYGILGRRIDGIPRRWLWIPLGQPLLISGACWLVALLWRARRIRRVEAAAEG